METLLLLAQDNGAWEAVGGTFAFIVLLGVVALALWVWALVDVIQNPRLDGVMRIVWVLVIVFAPIIGSLVYLLAGRNAGSVAEPR